jgi:putative peptide zinc metalloprotease protein
MSRAPLLSQDWYRVADLKPRLRPQVSIALHDYRGKPWYVLTDRSSGRSFRLPTQDFDILRRFDGKTAVEEIWNDLAWSGHTDLPPQDEFIELLSRLYDAGLVLVDSLPRFGSLARSQTAKKREWFTRFLKSPVTQKIPLFNPSPLIETRVVTALSHLVFSRGGAVVWGLLILSGLYTALANWEPLTANITDRALSPTNLIVMVCVYPFVKLLHELAHAMAVRRFGGTITQMGVMFLIFVPMPFVDASQANGFRTHSSRAVVAAAGILAEFAIAAIAVILWTKADPGLMRAILFNTMVICTISTLFFNGNPLLRFDAYFVLSDLTQTPGLATRGQRLLGRSFKKLLGVDPGPDPETALQGERLWMAGYAVAAGLYRIFIVFSIALIVASTLGELGQILAIWVLVGGLLWPQAKAAIDLVRSPSVLRRKEIVMARGFVLVAVLAIVVFVIPFPSRTTVNALVVHAPGAEVLARTEGIVEKINVKSGMPIKQSHVIITLANDRLVTEFKALEARLTAIDARLRRASARSEVTLSSAIERERNAVYSSLLEVERQINLGAVRAKTDGLWDPSDPAPQLGSRVVRGMLLGWVDQPEQRRLVGHIPEAAGRQMQRGIKGLKVLLSPNKVQDVSVSSLVVRPNATRVLAEQRMADRLGGPVLTDPESESGNLRALNSGYPMEISMDLSAVPVGRILAVKLMHPPEPLFEQIWPRITSVVRDRFGPGA